MKETSSRRFELTGAALHIIGMVLMLLDHTWGSIAGSQEWMTWVGRICFPIFAFLCAEGYRHTSDFKAYLQRMLLFACLSEIPFNLMMGGTFFYPLHQNVLFTFCLALLFMRWLDQIREKKKSIAMVTFLSGLVVLISILLGQFLFVDYYDAGIVTVLVFYFFRGRNIWSFLGQLACLFYINTELLKGLSVPVELFGFAFDLPQQSLALLALIPIWLYRGNQGHKSLLFRWVCYFFYPAHIFLLAALKMLGVSF